MKLQSEKWKKKLIFLLVSAFLFALVAFGLSLVIHPYYWNWVFNDFYADPDIEEQGVLTPSPSLSEITVSPSPVPKDWELYPFGRYEQDNITKNGAEVIEWIVLWRWKSKVLLISRYALDCQPFNTGRRKVTWETCSLRKWLNETFLQEAFTPEEQEKILTVPVKADKSKYSEDPGNATDDRIFLLSVSEADQFFSSDSERICIPSAYACAQGALAWTYTGGGACEWWLRTPGESRRHASIAFSSGYISPFGTYVNEEDIGVRPALWISLD